MYPSLYFKEWTKTHRLILLLGILFAGVTAYTFLNTSKMLQAGPIPVWGFILEHDLSLASYLKYLPGAAGILFAIVQFAPEMQNKRLKLTLHLPLNESRIVCTMLGYGVAALTVLFLLTCLFLLGGLALWFSKEIVFATFMKVLPWFLAGYATYLLGAWISFEPVWLQRVLNALPAACIVSFFYIAAPSGGYAPFLPYLIAVIAASFTFSFFSIHRFKSGVQ